MGELAFGIVAIAVCQCLRSFLRWDMMEGVLLFRGCMEGFVRFDDGGQIVLGGTGDVSGGTMWVIAMKIKECSDGNWQREVNRRKSLGNGEIEYGVTW